MDDKKEIEYRGHKYTFEGENIMKDGEFFTKASKTEIKTITEVKVLCLNNGEYLFFNGKTY